MKKSVCSLVTLVVALGLLMACAAKIQLPPTTSAEDLVKASAATPTISYNDPPALEVDGWKDARFATLEYAPGLKAAVCWPATGVDKALPTILFAMKNRNDTALAQIGKIFRELIPTIIWMADFAASGFVVVCPEVDTATKDMKAVLAWIAKAGPGLGMDPRRIGVFAASANSMIIPVMLDSPQARDIKAISVYYGDVQSGFWELGTSVGLQVVKAGQDFRATNNALDALAAKFTKAGNKVELIDYPEGRHGFDGKERGGRAAEIMRSTIDFFTRSLAR